MAGAFTAVDLSKLPYPDAVEQIDFQIIVAEMLADLQARDPAFSALVESDPAYKILEVCAYRETLIRQRNNEAVKAVTLAYATGFDLDNIAANYNVERLTLIPADPDTIPPTPAVMESDEDLRRRAQLSFEGFSTAGPEGAYIFHGLGADPDVLDISVDSPRFSMATIDPAIMALLPADSIVLQVDYDAGLSDPMPGTVAVNVLSRTGNGTADAELIEAVSETLSTEDVRPLTDNVITRTAQIINYSINAVLTVYPGPDSAVVLQAAIDAVEAYAEANHRLGRDVTLSGLYSALHQEGVQDVNLISPIAKVVANKNQATWCTGIVVTIGGTDE